MLTEEFTRLGVKSANRLVRQVLLLIEGCNSLILIHGDPSYAAAASAAARLLAEQHRGDPLRKRVANRANRSQRVGGRRRSVGGSVFREQARRA